MISRIWHGWTTLENADSFELVLKNEIITGIFNQKVAGFKEIQVCRRTIGNEEEFTTILSFESIGPFKEKAGAYFESPALTENAKNLLLRFEPKPSYYEVKLALKA